MQSSFEIIDTRISEQIAIRRHATRVSEPERAAARQAATRRIAGFPVFDEIAERNALDKMIADRRAAVEAFATARDALGAKLSTAGVSALAIVPTDAWAALCVQAKLFRMSPDSQGQVRVSRTGLAAALKLPAEVPTPAVRGSEPKRKWWEAAGIAELIAPAASAAPAWDSVLALLLPDFAEQPHTVDWNQRMQGQAATWLRASVVLPEAPADVGATLLRAAGAGFALQVAAVAEAIRFRETLAQLQTQEVSLAADEARRAEALRADPIIYTEADGATAIVAQFGDFPIEQAVVDTVVAGEKLFERSPQTNRESDSAGWASYGVRPQMFQESSGLLLAELRRQMAQQAQQERYGGGFGGAIGS